MSAPAVSVIMAAYNGAALIGETLASVQRQTLTDFEVIVVDDASSDATRETVVALADPRIRLVALPANGGPVRARNVALAHARGRHIAALDQDDLCRPDRLARQVAWLEAHPDAALVASATQVLDAGRITSSRGTAVTTPTLLEWLLLIENPLVWSSVMIRGDAARALEPFGRPALLYAEDFDLYHRLARLGEICRIDEPLLLYRRHAGGASQRHCDTMMASATRVLASAHETLLGEGRGHGADLIVRHLMGGAAVPDRATLARLGSTLAELQAGFLAQAPRRAEDVRLIRWETARRWARAGRAGLRRGTLRLADVATIRPDHLGLGYAGLDELVVSQFVGGARRIRAR